MLRFSLSHFISYSFLEFVANPCEDEPCKNGGTCNAFGGDFSCTCPDNWSGTTCEEGKADNCKFDKPLIYIHS